MTVLLPWFAVLLGFIGLVWSADRLVNGSAAIACNLGISKFIVGLTVVAFGTSTPEIIVSISSSLKGSGDLAIGNALGSNLANIGLVLGITALIAPLPIKSHTLKQEIPIMLLIIAIAGYFLYDWHLALWEGLILVLCVAPLIIWLAHSHKQHPEEVEDIESMKTSTATVWFLLGLCCLIISAESLVWGATTVALSLGISNLVVGLTIVAIGTSLPELATSIMSAIKGHHDIAIGNIIGSNMFNILLVAGIPAIIQPLTMTAEVFFRDFLSMLGLSIVLTISMVLSFYFSKNQHIGRLTGVLLLLLYAGYYTLVF
ncbi:calcium/sodium antiporter [Candidatus Endobugula sertula]|uniref:Calcium/sodium antiporter n=1 Tax=Candidatus Endobugula sertula TaxID=62101 RepID=A0A1D2QQK5_9GAMM|nr:calcium/sodium antiporter [Candidatus Endobugula sertula]